MAEDDSPYVLWFERKCLIYSLCFLAVTLIHAAFDKESLVAVFE